MAKVILCDNLDRETVPDELLEDNLTDEDAVRKAEDYNDEHDEFSDYYARAVPDSYTLWSGIKE